MIIKFGLSTLLVTASTLVLGLSAVATIIDFTQASSIERLSKQGWTFGSIQNDRETWLDRALLRVFPPKYLRVVCAAQAPKSYSPGTLASAISDLQNIKHLEIAVLNSGHLNEADILAVGKMSKCVELDLRFCDYDDSLDCLGRSIGQLKQLTTLRLSSHKLSGHFLQSMPVMNRLEHCEIAGLLIDASDIRYLINFPKLRYIDVSNSQFDLKTLPYQIRSRVAVVNPGILRIQIKAEEQ